MPQWYRLRAAAAALDVSTRTLRRYIASGRLPATRLPSGQYRIRADALDALDVPRDTIRGQARTGADRSGQTGQG